jgi:hypothetical protein
LKYLRPSPVVALSQEACQGFSDLFLFYIENATERRSRLVLLGSLAFSSEPAEIAPTENALSPGNE